MKNFRILILALATWHLALGTLPAQTPAKGVTANPNTGALIWPTSATFASANSLLTTSGAAAAYQPLDATLTALAGVTTAADKLIYATGLDAFSTTDLTAFGRAQLGISSLTSTALLLGAGAGAITASDITYSTPTLTVPTNFSITSTQSAVTRFTSNQTDARVELYESATRRLLLGYNTTNVLFAADGTLGLLFSSGATGNTGIRFTPGGTGGVSIGGAQLGTDMLTVVGRANMSAGLEWSWRHTDGVSIGDISGVRVDANNGYLAFRTRSSGSITEFFRITQTGTLQGGAGNMTITAGTGNSRTLALQTTTSGGTATTALTLGADQSATFVGPIIGGVQALSGAGAINATQPHTDYTSTGGAQALTLANGTVGQTKTISHVVDGGSGVLTPTTKIGFTTITFTNVGDSVTLRYTASGWAIVGIFGAVAA